MHEGFYSNDEGSLMRQIGVIALAELVLILGACGGPSPQPQSINGPWFAAVNNPDQSSAFPFTATLAQGSGATVTSRISFS